ncbi:MAG: HAMP domain-containing sensor histidine kinase [Patescibacteria group bacterium]
MQTALLIVSGILLIYLLKRNMEMKFTEKSFLSIVNHTFRTPLTRIKWMAQALEKEMPRKEQLEIVHDLDNSTDRLLEIVDILAGIKDIYSTSTHELKAVSIREIVEEAIHKYHVPLNEKHLTLSVPAFNDMPMLSVDTKKISFVIHVILENAILYSNDGGNIVIESIVKRNKLILKIKDNGIGLSWKDKNNLFNKFYRGERAKKMNTDGMGLGLYIAREIIRRHKGSIKAVSEGKDKGTTFYISLPAKS